jgi:hypothetical protein
MNAAHPLSVTSSKVIVHRYNVYTFPRKRVQVGRKGSYESFTLSGSHLGDHLIVKDRTADKLNIEMAHANNAPTRLSNNGERVRKKTVKRLAEIYPLLKASGLITLIFITTGRRALRMRSFRVPNIFLARYTNIVRFGVLATIRSHMGTT